MNTIEKSRVLAEKYGMSRGHRWHYHPHAKDIKNEAGIDVGPCCTFCMHGDGDTCPDFDFWADANLALELVERVASDKLSFYMEKCPWMDAPWAARIIHEDTGDNIGRGGVKPAHAIMDAIWELDGHE